MQVKELKKDGLSYEIEVIVPKEEIASKRDERLREVGKTARFPGFRPGKAPMSLLTQRYGKAVMGEVLEIVVNDATAKVIEDKKLRPAIQPQFKVKEFDDGKDLIYTMEIEVLPEFKIMDLKTISIERPVTKAGDDAINETIERIGKQLRDTEIVTEKRATKAGDVVIIDFEGRSGGKAHPGMKGEDHRLELGSKQFIEGFEDQLIGRKAGDKVTVKVTFPDPYHSAELAGKDAEFDVQIKELHQAKPLEINDEFAKKFGMENVQALRDTVRRQVQGEYDQLSRLKVKRALLDVLDESHEFPIPPRMLEMEYNSIHRQIEIERRQAGADAEPITDEEQEELRAIAGRRVRLGMVLSEVGRLNNVQITDQELQRAVIAEAQKYPGREADVFEYFRKNRQALEGLKAPVFEDKVVDFVLELVDVKDTEVSAEVLATEDDESYLEKKEGKGDSGAKKKKSDESAEDKPKKKPGKKG